MDALDRFDPALFRLWPDRTGTLLPFDGDDEDTLAAAREGKAGAAMPAAMPASLRLEIKSALPRPDASQPLRTLLNEMTVEMREQFSAFRAMRENAVIALSGGDEAAQKLARADVKAATDAMSLIVRTLEKVDSLQRQLAHDLALEAERAADAGGYEQARADLMRLIEDKAQERAAQLVAQLAAERRENADAEADRLCAIDHEIGQGRDGRAGPPAEPERTARSRGAGTAGPAPAGQAASGA